MTIRTKLKNEENFIKILIAGPEISLNASPTLSPITEFLIDRLLSLNSFDSCFRSLSSHSTIFFELSQADPELDELIAIGIPAVINPTRKHMSPFAFVK